jgi:PTS system mannose-specific IID component
MMISPLQALLVGLLYFAANTSFLAGLGYFTTWRPLVNGLLVGLALGDPLHGLYAGAAINLLYLGYLSVGGTLGIGDAALAGILGATAAIAVAPLNPADAVGIGVIAGVLLGNLGFPLLTLRMRLDNRIVQRMERAAAHGEANKIVWLNIAGGQGLLLAITVPAAAVLAFLIAPVLQSILPLLPGWLWHGLGVAGTGLAGALGIALAMKFVFKGYGIALFFAGFLLVAGLGLNPTLPVLAGLILCGLSYLLRSLLAGHIHLPRAVSTYALWQFFSHSSYSFERLQGSGVASALAPALQRLYPDVPARAQALERNLTFSNVEPNWGSVLLGVLLNMEEARAGATSIAATRQALMGAVSGFGDSVSQGAILPLMLSIGLGLSLSGSNAFSPALGVVVYLALICPLMLVISGVSFNIGYTRGRDGALAILGNMTLKRWVQIAEWLGALMLGALVALLAGASVAIPSFTGLHLNLLSGLAGGLLNSVVLLALVLVLYALVQKMRLKPAWILLGLCVIGILLAALGVA